MPSFLELFAPQWTELQRARARQQFQAGLQQPEIFQTENYPLQQLAQSYEKGYGVPYPRQQMPSPTAAIEGMTTDPNRGTTIQPPANLPLELVKPRSLEESTLRQAGIQGRGGAEKDLSSLQYYGENMPRLEGFFEDAGEDVGEYDIPASVGGFQRNQPTEPGKSYGDPYFDTRTQSLLQRETGSGEVSRIAGAPGEAGTGAGKGPEEEEYKRALDTYKALNERLDPITAQLLQSLGGAALQNPDVQDRIKGKLTPMEQKQLEYALQYIDWYQKRRSQQFGLGQIPTEQNQAEAATAESFLKKHIGK